jgi:hypothetical protein
MTQDKLCEQFENFESRKSEMRLFFEKQFGKTMMDKMTRDVSNFNEDYSKTIAKESNQLLEKMISAIESELLPDSAEVQALMSDGFDLSNKYTPMTKEIYIVSRENILEETFFAPMYDKLHPKLGRFMYDAMGVFLENHWKE